MTALMLSEISQNITIWTGIGAFLGGMALVLMARLYTDKMRRATMNAEIKGLKIAAEAEAQKIHAQAEADSKSEFLQRRKQFDQETEKTRQELRSEEKRLAKREDGIDHKMDTFSTKERASCLAPSVRPSLHAYLATVARNAGCDCYRVGGVADHVHLAVRLSRTVTIAVLVEKLKTASSKWLKTQAAALSGFAWQRGYGAFSVGPADLAAVVSYIDNQAEHHRTRSFQEEYRALLNKYGIEFDERFVWD